MPTLDVRYEPRGAARDLFYCKEREVLISGPAGTGKSLACLYRLHLACLRTPRLRCLVARKTGVSLTSTTLVTYKDKVANAAILSGAVNWFGGSRSEAAAYRYSNGSRIEVVGLDKPEKVLSSEYDLIFIDEATEITIDDWEFLISRLRNNQLSWQQILASCNPSHPTHWIKQRADRGSMTHLVSRHQDNPIYYNLDGTLTEIGTAYIIGILGGLTGVRRARLLDGRWVAAEGVIFEQWDDSIHLVKPFRVPYEWPRYWGIDFGYTNPFVCQMWAENPDGDLFMYRELYYTRRTVDVHARDIMKYVTREIKGYTHPEGDIRQAHHGREWIEPHPQTVQCDHDAGGRAILEREISFITKPAHKDVSEGIQAVQKRLVEQRLFVMEACRVEIDRALVDAKRPTSTYEEIPSYVWAEKKSKVDSGATVEADEPVKENDHGCDAMRYVVAGRDLKGRPRADRFL